MWKGGKAHGRVPRDFSFPINEKMRLMALKSLLSAKVFEEKIILIESESIPFAKTQFLNEIVSPYKLDKLLFLTSFESCNNFKLAANNI